MKKNQKIKIAIIGLGYVGLPLAISLSRYFEVIGFDKNKKRIDQLKIGIDLTKEVSKNDLTRSSNIKYTKNIKKIENSNVYIITVPTPINDENEPDLTLLIDATKLVAKLISKGDIVIYESTVYPGTTEEICVPILVNISKLSYLKDFTVGYSPERINPGDKKHKISDIVKVVSASDKKTLKTVTEIYSMIISAGIYKAESIKIAEAAKVIENIQRDVNIALINEFAIIFDKLNIDTYKVLEAAKTKWNFLEFYPGLVGGHCIGVDPYYLTYKSKEIGYDPKLILSGREINEKMSEHVTDLFLNKIYSIFNKKLSIKVLIMGVSFKENCPDTRNSKVFDIIKNLQNKKIAVHAFDPIVSNSGATFNKIILKKHLKNGYYHGIIIAVSHKEFKKMGIKKIRSYGKINSVIFDIKNIFNSKSTDLTL